MRTQLLRWLGFLVLCALVACGGGSGGGGGVPAQIISDPAMIAAVQDAFATPDPDVALQEFYALTGGVSSDTATKSFLDALQAVGDTEMVRSVIMNAGQIFGLEPEMVSPMAVTRNPCGNQQPTAIWFVNGVLTSPWNAIVGVRELKKVVVEANIGVSTDAVLLEYNKSGLDMSYPAHEFCLAFFGANGSNDPVFGIDRYWDVAFQSVCSGVSGVVDWTEAGAQWLNQWANLDLGAGDSEVTKFRVAIQQDIDGGKKVIIVAHSQGNFFAQRALEGISPVDLDAVGVLAIASPTPYPERGLYGFFQRLTLEHDIILTTNPAFPANGVNEISATASRIAIHGFVESYLNQPTSRQRIKQMLQAANAAISNPLALESGSYLRITAKWFEAGDVDLFVGEKDIAADLGAEVYWEFPNGVPQHLFGYLDRSEQVGPGSESYVVCSKANLLRGGCFVIRVYNKGIPAGSQVHVTVRAGTRIWAFIVFVPAPGPDFGSIAWVTDLRCRGDGTITLSNDCDLEVHPPPGGIDETGGK